MEKILKILDISEIGFYLVSVLQLVLILMHALEIIQWPWVITLIPLWVNLGVLVLLGLTDLILGLIELIRG